MPFTALSWLSKIFALPSNTWMDSSHAGGLHHAAVQSDVAVQHGQAAFLRVGVLDRADAAISRSSSRLSQRVDWLNATWVGMPAGPALKKVCTFFRWSG